MKFNNLLIFILLVVITISCKKQDDKPFIELDTNKYLVKMSIQEEDTTFYKYDTKNRLIKYYTSEIPYFTTYDYSDTLVLEKFYSYLNDYSNYYDINMYYLNEEGLTKKFVSSDSSNITTYNYNSTGQLLSSSFYTNINKLPKTIYYIWSNSNLIKVLDDTTKNAKVLYEIDYSDNNNILDYGLSFMPPLWSKDFHSKKLPAKIIITADNGSKASLTYNYIFDNKNRTVKEFSGNDIILRTYPH